jgi:SEC-C motif-containing protein
LFAGICASLFFVGCESVSLLESFLLELELNYVISCPTNRPVNCLCGANISYGACCQLLHKGIARAQSAEQLMRSRYSAFAAKEYQYLIDSHHVDTRGSLSLSELESGNRGTTWLGLEVISATDLTVNFRAYFQQLTPQNERAIHCLCENSRFVLEQNQWFYLDGKQDPGLAVLPSRKEPCFCGSGKKFKNCHHKLIETS